MGITFTVRADPGQPDSYLSEMFFLLYNFFYEIGSRFLPSCHMNTTVRSETGVHSLSIACGSPKQYINWPDSRQGDS